MKKANTDVIVPSVDSAVFRLFYLYFCCFFVLDVISITVYDRHTLLEIAPIYLNLADRNFMT